MGEEHGMETRSHRVYNIIESYTIIPLAPFDQRTVNESLYV
jgi:hypothetical protein